MDQVLQASFDVKRLTFQTPNYLLQNFQMLKYYLVLCCAAFALAEDKYTDKYDKIDLDEILGNKRLLQAYVNCILDKGKCTPEGKELKGKSLINSEHSAGQMSLISLKPNC